MRKLFKKIGNFFWKDKRRILLLAIFSLFIFLRFYEIETKSIFGFDQVDSAWAAKDIIVDHKFPLIGPENKLGSGFFVGPLYYYLISIFYFFTDLDPIAAGLFAGFTSVIGFFTLFFVTKKLFSFNLALIAVLLNTVSYSAIQFDRIQWEINFVPIVSTLAFYFLYKTIRGNEKNILYLGIILALAFHVHLTAAVFIAATILLTLPFFPKTKKTLLYFMYSAPILLLSLSPIIIVNILNDHSYILKQLQYAESSFHGINPTRISQLFEDAFIHIESYLDFPLIRFLSVVVVPSFLIIYYLNRPSRESFAMIYLVFLFFAVPLLILSTYSHEISDYYFSTNRFIGLIALSYIIYKLIELKKTAVIASFIIFTLYYSTISIERFFSKPVIGLSNHRAYVIEHVQQHKIIPFLHGSPHSYLYYFYTREKQRNKLMNRF